MSTPSLGMKWEVFRNVFWWSLGYLALYLLDFITRGSEGKK